MKAPSITTTTLATAVTGTNDYTYDMRGANLCSLQLNATLGNTNTDVITLTISNDGVNFVAFAVAKTVTFTGGGVVNALFELGAVDYAFLRVHSAAPSAGSLTLVGVMYNNPTTTISA